MHPSNPVLANCLSIPVYCVLHKVDRLGGIKLTLWLVLSQDRHLVSRDVHAAAVCRIPWEQLHRPCLTLSTLCYMYAGIAGQCKL